MQEALKLWEEGNSVYASAKKTGVPIQTLRDRTLGNVRDNVTASGPACILGKLNERNLAEHVSHIAKFGYGYSKAELCTLGTDMAIFLGLRKKDDPTLGQRWVDGFLQRNPAISLKKPRGLSIIRAKACSEETLTNYYNDLEYILDKYDLKNAPHLLFNVDETGINTEHSPPPAYASTGQASQAITSPRSAVTTIITCASATGQILPPFFVFKGKRFSQDLLEGALPGTQAEMSPTGWSNGEIFKIFLQHFLKFIPQRPNGQHALLVYDGHKSHINPEVIKWALEDKIVLFVLPAHTSHVTQPLDVSCFGPLKKIFFLFYSILYFYSA